MSCRIAATHLEKSQVKHPETTFHAHSKVYKFVQTKLNNFCFKNNKEKINIHNHHIVLRSKGILLPVLMSENSGQSGKKKSNTNK
jgi:hypothetical protein